MMCDNRTAMRMLRLLLALLLALPAALAASPLPEAAPVHAMDGQAMAHDMIMHHHGDEMPTPGHAKHHDCIGCIAPIDISVYRPVSLARGIAWRDARPIDTDLLLARTSAPEPPPPRTSV